MPLWEHRTCAAALRSQFGPSYTLPDTAMCAGAEGRDACDVSSVMSCDVMSCHVTSPVPSRDPQGDGGGPLVCRDGSQWHQVGQPWRVHSPSPPDGHSELRDRVWARGGAGGLHHGGRLQALAGTHSHQVRTSDGTWASVFAQKKAFFPGFGVLSTIFYTHQSSLSSSFCLF